MSLLVRPLEPRDAEAWERMRTDLWPGGDHSGEVRAFIEHGPQPSYEAVLIAERDGVPVGFAELSIRTSSPGCDTDRIAYLEGWYVAPQARATGVGRALVKASEAWGIARGCREFASDVELENTLSQRAHDALGFTEVERVVFYMKNLSETA